MDEHFTDSFRKAIEQFNGQIITILPQAGTFINPFNIVLDDGDCDYDWYDDDKDNTY